MLRHETWHHTVALSIAAKIQYGAALWLHNVNMQPKPPRCADLISALHLYAHKQFFLFECGARFYARPHLQAKEGACGGCARELTGDFLSGV